MASDLISREALIDELKEDVEFESPTFNQCVNSAMSSAFRIAIKRVKAATAVDAVEVVRCEKCRYCYPVGSIPLCGANGYFAPIPYDIKTHFCRFGERMVEDAD